MVVDENHCMSLLEAKKNPVCSKLITIGLEMTFFCGLLGKWLLLLPDMNHGKAVHDSRPMNPEPHQ